jgi:hypothetical protein
MRLTLIATLLLLFSLATPATAQVHISIGINVPTYPVLERVPGYPVYYAPRLNSNYFFYDGLYWVYQGDNWYASQWYNGPWDVVDRYEVPAFVLRVPVRYYRAAPAYFRGWRADAAPHWGMHWGTSWAERRYGWDQWDRRSVPAAAPLPTYQRQYSGSRYPQQAAQVELHTRSYSYQPRDEVVQQHYQKTRGHPPGQAKGWGGDDRPPGKAKGWDKEQRAEGRGNEGHGNEGRGNDGRGNEGRGNEGKGKGKGHDKD